MNDRTSHASSEGQQANLSLNDIGTALRDLGEFMVIRTDGDSVSPWVATVRGAEIGGDGMLTGLMDSGATPEEAIRNLWGIATGVPSDRYILARATSRPMRRKLRWSGFMWRDVTAEAVNHAGA